MAAKKGPDLSALADDLAACADTLTNACHRLGGGTGSDPRPDNSVHVRTLQRVEPQVRALAEYLDGHDTEILAALEAAGSTKETKADG